MEATDGLVETQVPPLVGTMRELSPGHREVGPAKVISGIALTTTFSVGSDSQPPIS
jgi:hypothetical protein